MEISRDRGAGHSLTGRGHAYRVEQSQYYQRHESTDDSYVLSHITPICDQVEGTVLTVHVENHQKVKAGQLLMVLDPHDFESQVQQAKMAVGMTAADLSHAKIDAE